MRTVTKIDSGGRIALSPKMRKVLKVEIGDYVQIEIIENKLIMSKFTG